MAWNAVGISLIAAHEKNYTLMAGKLSKVDHFMIFLRYKYTVVKYTIGGIFSLNFCVLETYFDGKTFRNLSMYKYMKLLNQIFKYRTRR